MNPLNSFSCLGMLIIGLMCLLTDHILLHQFPGTKLLETKTRDTNTLSGEIYDRLRGKSCRDKAEAEITMATRC